MSACPSTGEAELDFLVTMMTHDLKSTALVEVEGSAISCQKG